MGKTVQEVSTIAAEWWADVITKPKFDNGDTSFANIMCKKMAERNVSPVSAAGKVILTSRLVKTIIEKLERCEQLVLCVDYGPDTLLSAAAVRAGISLNNFPWKTTMWVSKDHVEVRYGFNGSPEMLYANKAYYDVQITNCKRSLQRYHEGHFDYIKDPIARQSALDGCINELTRRIAGYALALEVAEE